jgi:hypothetical protein
MGPIQLEKDEPVFHAPWEARLRNDSRDGCVALVEPRRVPLPARVDPSSRVLAHELLRKMDCGAHGADGQDWL